MHNLRRFYYNNKIKIWRVILIIASILIIIQLLNGMIGIRSKNAMELANSNKLQNNNNNVNANINSDNTNTTITSNKSSVTGEILTQEKIEDVRKIINSFVDYCNNGNIEQAYNLLSNDCKNELYTDINKFKTLYYDTIFGGSKKTASAENWILNTYKVNITNDIMATGNANGMKTQDYITIVKEENENKLNINSFVKKEKINKSQTIENIKFTVISKNIYMDYEEYEIQVENQTEGRILLDTQRNTKSIYLEDSNETKYYAYSNEILSGLLNINKGFSTKLNIRFSKSYSIERITNNIVFSEVIMNYNENTNEQINKKQIKIAF